MSVTLYPEEVYERVKDTIEDETQLPRYVPAVILHEEGAVDGTRPRVYDAGDIPEDVVDEVGDVQDDVCNSVEDDCDCRTSLELATRHLVPLGVVDLMNRDDAADGNGDYG